MITFKEITLDDKEIITHYTLNSPRMNCDLSFSNLCSWRFMYDTVYAEVGGFLVLKFWADGQLVYMMPIGEGNARNVLELMIDDSRKENHPLVLLGVCQYMKAELEEIMPGKFTFGCDRNFYDYIYLRSDLATLSGKKYQSKRNHINKFRNLYPDYKYLPITPDLIPECLRMEAEWCIANGCHEQEGTGNERRAIIFALNNFERLGLSGGLLHVGGKIVAFTFGMPINQNTFGTHVEKADTNIEGAYTMINYEFANHIPGQYTYINREEDLGLEGLRKAKLSYHPAILLEKSTARYHE